MSIGTPPQLTSLCCFGTLELSLAASSKEQVSNTVPMQRHPENRLLKLSPQRGAVEDELQITSLEVNGPHRANVSMHNPSVHSVIANGFHVPRELPDLLWK